MLKRVLSVFALAAFSFFGISLSVRAAQAPEQNRENLTGTLEKMIVTGGTVALNLDLNRLRETEGGSAVQTCRFGLNNNSSFTILVFDHVVRGPEAGSLELLGGNSATLPEPLNALLNQLVIEKTLSGNEFDLVIRDGKTGSVVFNIVGHQYDYDDSAHALTIGGGKLLISTELARRLGRPSAAGVLAGNVSIQATLVPIEISTVVNGAVQSSVMPARPAVNPNDPTAVPGPDVIVGDLPAMEQFGSDGTNVALAIATTSCNNGTVDLNWFALPEVDHPVIPQNLYLLAGDLGAAARGDNFVTTFSQIGQSWLKHAFTALTQNACGFGCNGVGGPHLGVGCSDPYSSSLNGGQNRLGSRAWVNPFNGVYTSSSCNHGTHSHDEMMHRLIVRNSDLHVPNSFYFAEAQYVTPHEYAWCQSHPGQCNMYNNASYRQFNVNGAAPNFTFSPVGSTVRMAPALAAWDGATINTVEPAPGVDGRAFVAYRVAQGLGSGEWYYNYAILNQNLDRAIQSFTIPLGCGIALTEIRFSAPPNHPGIAEDGTLNNAGYSNALWTLTQSPTVISWSTQTFAQNPNANALRWGTLYNFSFRSPRPPQNMYAVIGFYKTGAPITVPIQGPAGLPCSPGGRR